ncbi:hypothetical protein ScPMuIL_008048 [Solemya velum]
MPFFGRDWRDPGAWWERRDGGWKPLIKKCGNSDSEDFCQPAERERQSNQNNMGHTEQQPHINYVRGTAKMKKITVGLSESFIQLGMMAASKESTSLLYVYKVIRYILTEKWDKISGTAQKKIFMMLENLVMKAIETESNINKMKDILRVAKESLNICQHSSPKCLWNQHLQSLNRMVDLLNNFQYSERYDEYYPQFADLPKECIYTILRLLSDHRDLLHFGNTCNFMHILAQDQSLWKDLCRFHFGPKQLFDYLPSDFEDGDVNWSDTYKMAVKKYGQKKTFTNSLVICRNCRILYWKTLGHPCPSEEEVSFESLSPEDFVELFHL